MYICPILVWKVHLPSTTNSTALSFFLSLQLLKSALTNSIQGRRRGGNNSLVEITNRTLENQTPSLDARFGRLFLCTGLHFLLSADTTMRKKGRAMAVFKASQEEETPRTIMSNFMEAHKVFECRHSTLDNLILGGSCQFIRVVLTRENQWGSISGSFLFYKVLFPTQCSISNPVAWVLQDIPHDFDQGPKQPSH